MLISASEYLKCWGETHTRYSNLPQVVTLREVYCITAVNMLAVADVTRSNCTPQLLGI